MSDAQRSPRPSRAASSAPDELVTAVLTASRVLVAVSASSLADVEDTVTLAQFRTLVVLESARSLNLNQLAERLAVNASTALRTIDRLLAAGLVTRTESSRDRREVSLELTAAGATLVSDVTERRRHALAAIVRRMPRAQRAELIAALTAFTEAAGEPAAVARVAAIGW